MTVDPAVYALAKARLTASGWTWSGDHLKLAELIEDCIHDYEQDLHHADDLAQRAAKS